VLDQVLPGQKHHGQLDAPPADGGEQINARHPGHVPIEDNDMGVNGLIECPEELPAIGKMPDADAAFRQRRNQHVGVFFVGLGKENADGLPTAALHSGHR
jgi:hypothetical protein